MADIQKVLSDIKSKRVKRVILDTDTYNEIDDQYAVALSVLSQDKLDVLSINAAPFFNTRSSSAGDGMEKSYNEIFHILKLCNTGREIPVYKGSDSFLSDKTTPVESDAAKNIVKTVTESDEIIYVLAVGAITNVASAILMNPEIIENMVVVWLGGNSLHSPNTKEFNMVQDIKASQIILDSKVPLVIIPCDGVCDRLLTTIPELEACLSNKNNLCDYLLEITTQYVGRELCRSKVIWDISAPICLTNPEYAEMTVIPAPRLTDDCYYASDLMRHHIIYVRKLNRDSIFKELFSRLEKSK